MNILPAWLPSAVTISIEDVEGASRISQSEKHHQFVYHETDPEACPLVRALKRVIPAEFWRNIWIHDDFVVNLDTPDRYEFSAKLSKLDSERLSQYDRDLISPLIGRSSSIG